MQKELEKTLIKLGLSGKELLIYDELLQKGAASASRIARNVSFPRQTVYSILSRLAEGGFVEQSDRRGVRIFFADTTSLFDVIDKQKRNLEESKKVVEEEMSRLTTQKRGSVPRVRYYEGESGLKRLFENILEQYRKGAEKMFRGYGVNFISSLLGGFIPTFFEERNKLGVKTNLFVGIGHDDFGITNEKTALGRTVKHAPISKQDAGVYIIGDRTYMFSFEENVGVMVEDESITKLMKSFFDDYWKRVPEEPIAGK